MLRTLLARAVLAITIWTGAALSDPALAQTAAPTSVEECLRQLQALVAEAHAIDLLDDQIDQAEAAIARMERHCLASEFTQAMAAADDVHKILATNK